MGIEFGQVLKSVKVTTQPGTPGTEGPTSPPDPIRGYRLTMERIPMVGAGPSRADGLPDRSPDAARNLNATGATFAGH